MALKLTGSSTKYWQRPVGLNRAGFGGNSTGTGLTILVWLRNTTALTASTNCNPVCIGSSSTNGWSGINLFNNGTSDGVNVGECNDASSVAGHAALSGAFTDNVWSCIICQYLPNGEEIGQASSNPTVITSSTNTYGALTYASAYVGFTSPNGITYSTINPATTVHVAEFACWTGLLGAGEIAQLYAGANPSTIQPGILQFYYPLRGDLNDFGSQHLSLASVGGAVATYIDHPPVNPIPNARRGWQYTATTVILTSGTTWSVPAGITSLSSVECWGAGGGGSDYRSGGTAGGNAGGGGAWAEILNYSVTPGASIPIQIGAGGAGGIDGGTTTTAAGSAGTSTYFNSTTTVMGAPGQGGSAANFTSNAAGGTTAASFGTNLFAGGAGGANKANAYNPGGGASGSPQGAGGAGQNGDVGYLGGSSPGAGAGGGGDTNGVSNVNGGGGGGGSDITISGIGGTPGGGGGSDFSQASNAGAGGVGQIRIVYLTGGASFTATVSATTKKPTSNISGSLNESATISATTKKQTSNISGSLNESATVSATTKKNLSSITANVSVKGTLSATTKKNLANINAIIATVAVVSGTTKKPLANFNLTNYNEFGPVLTSTKKPLANLTGYLNETGTVTAIPKKIISVIFGVNGDAGTITATTKKQLSSISGTFTASNETGTLSATTKKQTSNLIGNIALAGVVSGITKKNLASFTSKVNEVAIVSATTKKNLCNMNGTAIFVVSGSVSAITRKTNSSMSGYMIINFPNVIWVD